MPDSIPQLRKVRLLHRLLRTEELHKVCGKRLRGFHRVTVGLAGTLVLPLILNPLMSS